MRRIRGKRDDTIAKCIQAYRAMDIKIGPSLGIAICKSGFSFDLMCGILKISKATLYGWMFGRSVPHRGLWNEVNKTTRLLEIALDSGDVPNVNDLTLADEHVTYSKLLLKHSKAVEKSPITL